MQRKKTTATSQEWKNCFVLSLEAIASTIDTTVKTTPVAPAIRGRRAQPLPGWMTNWSRRTMRGP